MIVLDSSFVIALLTPDRRQSFVVRTLQASGDAYHAPALLLFEVVHVLSRKRRNGDLSLAEQDRAFDALTEQAINFDPAPDTARLARIAGLADAERLSGYEASYLELAIRLGAQLATLDADLAEAGRHCGVVVHHTP